MWSLFADASESLPVTVPQLIVALIGSGGLGALVVKAISKYFDNQKDLQIARLSSEKEERAQEAERKAAESLAVKEASNEVFSRMKSLINRFEKENAKWGDRYEAKCREALENLVQLEDLQKKHHQLSDALANLESDRDALKAQLDELQKHKAASP